MATDVQPVTIGAACKNKGKLCQNVVKIAGEAVPEVVNEVPVAG